MMLCRVLLLAQRPVSGSLILTVMRCLLPLLLFFAVFVHVCVGCDINRRVEVEASPRLYSALCIYCRLSRGSVGKYRPRVARIASSPIARWVNHSAVWAQLNSGGLAVCCLEMWWALVSPVRVMLFFFIAIKQ